MRVKARGLLLFLCLLATGSLVVPEAGGTLPVAGDEITAEELIAKHLASIGTAAARASIKNHVILGSCTAQLQGRITGVADGQIVLASEGNKSLIGMKFGSPEYPHERLGFDGKKLTVGYLKPGSRSPLGGVLLSQDAIFKEGLVGGTLTKGWPLLNLTEKKAKLTYAGTGSLANKKVYKLRYNALKGADLTITLFFDAATFRHVRTEYERAIPASLGTGGIDSSSRQRGARVNIVEEFSDYKPEGNLTLPHAYSLGLYVDSPGGTNASKWSAKLTQFMFNQQLDAGSFNVESFSDEGNRK